MSANTVISIDKLLRLIGTPGCPAIVDVRTVEDFKKDPRLIPGSVKRAHGDVAQWSETFKGRSVVTICEKGLKISHGVAAWLRHAGAQSEALEGGTLAWAAGHHPMVPAQVLPPRDAQGRTVWVTRSRPKVDRIACPWLIRRFVDPSAVFLYVSPSEVMAVAERFSATPFDIEGANVFWTHRGELCTFDVMVEEFGLGGFEPLQHLAAIVRAADTDRHDLAPQAAGLMAASLGLSRMFSDDLEQLEAGMLLYDAFFRWCRDASSETHDWTSHTPSKTKARSK